MMKTLLNIGLAIIMVFATACSLYGQATGCIVTGTVHKSLPYKYAYLYNSKKNIMLKAPVVLSHFRFNAVRYEELTLASLFFGMDSLMTYNILLEKKAERIFEEKILAIEDSVNVYVPTENMKEALVTGGPLNKALNDMYLTSNKRNYAEFFLKYPDSPVSLLYLKVLINISKTSMGAGIDCPSYYNSLSSRLKNCEEGKELFKKL